MRVLGLDIAGSTGWAVFDDHDLIVHGNLTFRRDRLVEGLRAARDLIVEWNPDVVAVEEVRFAKFVDAHASYWRIRTLFEISCQPGQIEWLKGTPSAIKKQIARISDNSLTLFIDSSSFN